MSVPPSTPSSRAILLVWVVLIVLLAVARTAGTSHARDHRSGPVTAPQVVGLAAMRVELSWEQAQRS